MKSEAIKILERLLHWSKRKPNGCLVCYLGLTVKGYSRLNVNNEWIAAHRMIMCLVAGLDLDSDLQVLHRDDVCHSRACIEFNHLKVGTSSDNAKDKIKKHGGYSQKRTHCPQGHAYTGKVNINGKQVCHECQKVTWRKSNRRIAERKKRKQQQLTQQKREG